MLNSSVMALLLALLAAEMQKRGDTVITLGQTTRGDCYHIGSQALNGGAMLGIWRSELGCTIPRRWVGNQQKTSSARAIGQKVQLHGQYHWPPTRLQSLHEGGVEIQRDI